MEHDLLETQLNSELAQIEENIAKTQTKLEEFNNLRFDLKIKISNCYNSIMRRYYKRVDSYNKSKRSYSRSSTTDKWVACDMYRIKKQTITDLHKNGYKIPEWLEETQKDLIDCLSG